MGDSLTSFFNDILSCTSISSAFFEMLHDKTGELRYIDGVCGKKVSDSETNLLNATRCMTVLFEEIINAKLLSVLLTYSNVARLDYRNPELFEYILQAEREIDGEYAIKHNILTASRICKMIVSNDISEGGFITHDKVFYAKTEGKRKSHFDYIVYDKPLIDLGITRVTGDDIMVYVSAYYKYMLDHDKQNVFEFVDVKRLKRLYSLLGNDLTGEGYLSNSICNDLLVRSFRINDKHVTTEPILNGRALKDDTTIISGYEATTLTNVLLNAYSRYCLSASELGISNIDRFFTTEYLTSIAPNRHNYHNIADKLMALKGYLGILVKNPYLTFSKLQEEAYKILGEDNLFFDRKELASMVTNVSLFNTVSNVRANKLTPIYNSFGHNDGHILTMIRSVKYGNYFYNHGNFCVYSRFYPETGEIVPRVHVKIEDMSKLLASMWKEDLDRYVFGRTSDEEFDKSKSIIHGPENSRLISPNTSGTDDD